MALDLSKAYAAASAAQGYQVDGEAAVNAALPYILEALAAEAQREHHEAWQEYDNVSNKRSHEAGLALARRTETLDANVWLRRKLRELG